MAMYINPLVLLVMELIIRKLMQFHIFPSKVLPHSLVSLFFSWRYLWLPESSHFLSSLVSINHSFHILSVFFVPKLCIISKLSGYILHWTRNLLCVVCNQIYYVFRSPFSTTLIFDKNWELSFINFLYWENKFLVHYQKSCRVNINVFLKQKNPTSISYKRTSPHMCGDLYLKRGGGGGGGSFVYILETTIPENY